jgi:preprotein translocase subunit SecG
MSQIVLVIHLMIALALVGVILMQRSEGGALGIGGGSGGAGGMGGFMSGRGAANLLTRATAVLAVAFMATSLGLALLAQGSGESRSILEVPPAQVELEPAPAEPEAPALPAVPQGQ